MALINKPIKYRDGYSGQLAKTAQFQLPIELFPPDVRETEFIRIDATGLMTIRIGYAWDYASVPIFHKFANWWQGKKSKVPSLAHDALCQMERAGYLGDVPDARLHIDRYFLFLLNERRFFKFRKWLWFFGVRIGSTRESSNRPILEAE
jgi:hypothetical protein